MSTFNEKWAVIRKINNFSLLRMISVGKDWHLRHSLKFLNQEQETEFDNISKRYLSDELHRLEYSLDDCLKRYSRLFLGDPAERLMDLHIRTQRSLRDYSHRDHVNHMLSVWLLTAYLLQIDLDVLTLTRNVKYLQKRLFDDDIPTTKKSRHPKWYPAEETLKYYPDGEIFAKAFDPSDDYRGKYFYADTFYFLFLFHDIGYLYEFIEKVDPSLREEIERTLLDNFSLSEYTTNEKLLKSTLEKILCFPFSKRKDKFEPLVDLALKQFNDNKNHGVVSSLILYRDFRNDLFVKPTRGEKDYIEEVTQKEQEEDKNDYINDCLGAICLHDLEFNEDLRIRIQDSLYYFLLKLSDTLCDWSRYFQGRKTYYPIQLIDEILFGFCPEKRDGKECVRLNIIFDFSNLDALISEDIGEHDYEIKDFKKKQKELNHLDYMVEKNDTSDPYQWLFFEIILIDRNGERHMLTNEGNKVEYSKIECPLFS